jgi:hypothetical protein
MARKEETTICEFCRKGHVIQRLEDIAFRQWSDKGWISCQVAVSIGVCNVCNARTLLGGDKILDEAFQREYDMAARSRRVADPAGRPLSARHRAGSLFPFAASSQARSVACLLTPRTNSNAEPGKSRRYAGLA